MLSYYNMVNLFIVYFYAIKHNHLMYAEWQCNKCISNSETICEENPKTLCCDHNLKILEKYTVYCIQ